MTDNGGYVIYAHPSSWQGPESPLRVRFITTRFAWPRDLTTSGFAQASLQALERTAQQVIRRAKINLNDLSGRFLRVRSGRLRSSVQGMVGLMGGVLSALVGTNVWYGKLHEFGGTFGYMRTFRPTFHGAKGTGKMTFATRRQIAAGQRLYQPPPAPRTVFAHFRERPWLRTAVAESRTDIEANFQYFLGRLFRSEGGGIAASTGERSGR
jgi:phage gpG-like protein